MPGHADAAGRRYAGHRSEQTPRREAEIARALDVLFASGVSAAQM